MVRLGRALFGDRPLRRPAAPAATGCGEPVDAGRARVRPRRVTHYAVAAKEPMANSFLKKTMVYLGLLDDEYDEYDDYDEPRPGASPGSRPGYEPARARGAGRAHRRRPR